MLLQWPDLVRAGLFPPLDLHPVSGAGFYVDPSVALLRSLQGREGKRKDNFKESTVVKSVSFFFFFFFS